MSNRTLCIIHEAVGAQSAIAKIALAHARIALSAGWQVSVVAKYVDESLRPDVRWLPLTVPRRAFFLKWITARHFIRKAMGSYTFDVIHALQPQVADLSDVFECQFLTRVAYERNCLEMRRGLRPRLIRVQQQGVLYAEDHFYRRWNPATHMLFCSKLLQREFARLYGMPPSQEVLVNACPPVQFPTAAEREAARTALVGAHFRGLVLGYLGGVQERKGYRRVLHALQGQRDILLLMGGQYTQGFVDPMLAGHMKSLGLVSDLATFYAACDAFVVPSLFDPCPLVVFEAAARGSPVIATEGVGNLHLLLEYDAGVEWQPGQSLGDLVRLVASERSRFNAGAARMATAISQQQQGHRLLEIYDRVAAHPNRA